MSAVVFGDGLLADLVYGILSEQCEVVRQLDFSERMPEKSQLALVLTDAWNPSILLRAEDVFQSGTPWLRGFTSFGYGVVGPLVRQGAAGCSQCADMRRIMAGTDRKEMLELHQKVAASGERRSDPWASRTGLLHVGHLVAVEAQRVIQGSPSHLEEHMYYVNLKSLKTSRHLFLPNPGCSLCGKLPEDTPAAADIPLNPSPKVSIESYRCRSMAELGNALVRDYLDDRTGLLNGEMQDLATPFAAASVILPLLQGDEATAGRTLSYAESRLTAILEGLERYCGQAPRGKRTAIHACFDDLKGHALDPVTVGVHAMDQYKQPDFPFKPFDPKRPIGWVWGYSFLHRHPILVPELLAYYSLGCGDGYVYETSNGCAVGGSMVEAIFHGIMEVVERDAFLLTWYAQLPLARLDLQSANDKDLVMMVDRVQTVTGYDLFFYDATMENGIPSVWGMAKNTRQHGVNLICAGGSHLDPVRAVKGAIHELAGMLLTFDEKFEANREVFMQMYRDPFQVRQMEDHSMLYSLPEAEERLNFLLDNRRPVKTLDEAFTRRARHADLTDDLTDILQAFRRLNLDVIVVDQTTPELKRNALYCVKVLIPGMLPITFGYHLTRLEGLDRVLQVPKELGYTAKPLTRRQLNPHPHPFP